MEFSGTLTLSHGTFAAVVKEVIASVLRHGFYKIILFNSHGGNQGICQVIVEQSGQEFPEAHFVGITWWNLAREALKEISETGPGGTGHACEFETSLMECIAGHLVDKEKIQKGRNIPGFPWAEGDMLHGAKASYYRSMHEMTSNGVFGDPTMASAEKGRRITAAVLSALREVTAGLFAIRKNRN
jgi:creatinine amidohydrolase